MGEGTKQIQEPRARTWDGLHQAALAVLSQHVPPPRDVWDIACGPGAFSKLVLEAGYHVHAVDGDIRQFRVPGVPRDSLDLNDAPQVQHFIRANGCRAHVTVALEIIEHLRDPWAFLQFCADMTRPGGHILLSTPHIQSIFSRLLFLRTGQFLMFQEYRKPFGHINPVTANELEAIFDHCRLKVVVKAFPCKMPTRGDIRHRLGMLASMLIRPFAKGDKEGIILMYLLRKPGHSTGDSHT